MEKPPAGVPGAFPDEQGNWGASLLVVFEVGGLVVLLVVLDDLELLLGLALALLAAVLRSRLLGRLAVLQLLEGLLLAGLELAVGDRLDDRLDLRVLETVGPVVPRAVACGDLAVDAGVVLARHLADQRAKVAGLDLLADLLADVLGEVADPEGDLVVTTARALGLLGDVLVELVQLHVVVFDDRSLGLRGFGHPWPPLPCAVCPSAEHDDAISTGTKSQLPGETLFPCASRLARGPNGFGKLLPHARSRYDIAMAMLQRSTERRVDAKEDQMSGV